jgi:hypothetical protein
MFLLKNKIPDPNPDKPEPKRNPACPEIPNPKSQIPNQVEPFGQTSNAFGEEHTAVFLILKIWGKIFGL